MSKKKVDKVNAKDTVTMNDAFKDDSGEILIVIESTENVDNNTDEEYVDDWFDTDSDLACGALDKFGDTDDAFKESGNYIANLLNEISGTRDSSNYISELINELKSSGADVKKSSTGKDKGNKLDKFSTCEDTPFEPESSNDNTEADCEWNWGFDKSDFTPFVDDLGAEKVSWAVVKALVDLGFTLDRSGKFSLNVKFDTVDELREWLVTIVGCSVNLIGKI